jgi:hypothetical protein
MAKIFNADGEELISMYDAMTAFEISYPKPRPVRNPKFSDQILALWAALEGWHYGFLTGRGLACATVSRTTRTALRWSKLDRRSAWGDTKNCA